MSKDGYTKTYQFFQILFFISFAYEYMKTKRDEKKEKRVLAHTVAACTGEKRLGTCSERAFLIAENSYYSMLVEEL